MASLLTHDALHRPGAMLNVHLAGVPSDALFDTSSGASAVAQRLAGDFPHAVRHMEDCDAAHAAVASLGCVEGTAAADLLADCATAADAAAVELESALDDELVVELAAAAGAELTAEGFTFVDGDGEGAAFTLPRAGGGPEVDALLRELTCFLSNTKAAMKANEATGEGTPSGAGASATAAAATQRLFNARLEKSAGVRESFGAGSREAAAAVRLTAGAAKAAVARAHDARGGKVVSLITVPDTGQLGATAASRRRRALLQASSSDGLSLTPSQKFRNMSVATVVAIIIFIVAACGLLAMVNMSFPSDSLLYPRDKNE